MFSHCYLYACKRRGHCHTFDNDLVINHLIINTSVETPLYHKMTVSQSTNIPVAECEAVLALASVITLLTLTEASIVVIVKSTIVVVVVKSSIVVIESSIIVVEPPVVIVEALIVAITTTATVRNIASQVE